MKLSKICVRVLMFLLLIAGTRIHAETYVPKEIKLFTPEAQYNAGTSQDVGIIPSKQLLRSGAVYEIGIARERKNGFITSFDIVSSEIREASDQIRFSIKIPNVQKEFATSTYVIYLKSYVKNDPESENFVITKPFLIVANENPFVSIQNINILQDTGVRAGLTEGPTIYNPVDYSTSSTTPHTASIEVTFDSNTDTVLKPVISFSKLRSSVTLPDHVANDIEIHKGKNYVTIPLPDFSYEPGVYQGKVNFRNELLPSIVDLQYVVGGESVTVGQITDDMKSKFTFAVFGTPIDLRNPTIATTSEIHSVQTAFMFKGKQVFATTTLVNFSSSSFDIVLPAHVKNADAIQIEVTSNTTGKSLFKDTKAVNFSIAPKFGKIYILYILLLALLMVFAFLQHKKKFIIVLILFTLLIIGKQVFADAWGPNGAPYLTASANNLYITENYSNPIHLFFSENLTEKTFTCGERLTFFFQIKYIQCANTYAGVKIGFATTSQAAANTAQIEVTNNSTQNFLLSQTVAAVSGTHYFYTNSTGFFKYDGEPVRGNVSTLYVGLSSTADDNAFFDPGYSTFSIPLTVSPCTACTNSTSTSNIPNFQVAGRNYYFSETDQRLYFRDDNPLATDPAANCGIDMCPETTANESRFPSGTSWKPSPGTYSTDPTRYACLPINVTCACNNSRNRVCTNSSSGTTSTDINHSSCIFKAYCTTSYQDIGKGTVTFDAVNKLGSLMFIPSGNPVVVNSIPDGGVKVLKKVVDNFDGKISTVSCELNFDDSTTNNSATPSILKFFANPKVVSEGGKCRFGWQTNNMTSCTIDGVAVPLNITAGDLYAPEFTSSVNDINLSKKLICTGNVATSTPITVSTTTTCFVNPRVREN